MTILQALTAAVQVPGVDNTTLVKACIDAELTDSQDYTKADEKAVDLAAVNVLQSLIVEGESEGGFSYTISKEALQIRINFLLGKWGVTDEVNNTQPKVNRASVW